MKVFKIGLSTLALLLLNGCVVAVHDGIEAVKRSSEIKSKSEQLLITKEKAEFIDGVNTIHVSFVVKDLDANTSKIVPWKASLFCNEYKDSKKLLTLKQDGALVPKCVFGDEKGQINLVITESKSKEYGVWNQFKFDAEYQNFEGTKSYHYIDRDRETVPGFIDIVLGLTATIIDVNRS